METDLTALILANAGLTAQIGNRFNWNTRPQGQTGTSMVATNVAADRNYEMVGRAELTAYVVQFDIWATSALKAAQAREALIAFVEGLRGSPFQRAFVENERSSFEVAEGPETASLHRASVDVRLWHSA